MAGLEKFRDLVHLDLEIMRANLEPEPHLLHVKRFGCLAVLLLLLGALIVILTPIDDFANWRISVWRNFYQIELTLLREAQGLLFA